MPDHRRIAIDLQPLQGYSSRRRGIGRYVLELVTAIVERHRDRVHSLLINPNRGIPPEIERFLGTGLVQTHSAQPPVVDGAPPDIYYVTSPFELDLTLDEIWPRWARDPCVDTVVTLYDLIPTLFPDHYLADPIWQAIHWARLEFVKQADLVLCISQATAEDALEHLGFPPHRVTNICTGVSDHFFPPENPTQAMTQARELVEGLRPGFLMYTGGIDFRKNLPGLLEAYALLPDRIRGKRQLVIVCRVLESERDALMNHARALGIEDDVLLTGFVPDATLAILYQSADLFVFPSIYEGFGLPIAEAVLSGTLAIASDSSSMVELVTDPDLRFDPNDPADIARCITAALDMPDAHLRRDLQHTYVAENFHWRGVADRAIEAMDALVPRPHTEPVRRRARIAMVTPVPPAESGVADYSWRLAHALAEYVDVDLVAEDPETQPTPTSPNVSLISGPGLVARDDILTYDEVIYVMGNSSHHSKAYDLMGQRHGTVMIHEARFTGFFEWYGRAQGHEPGWFHWFLRQEYEGVEPTLGEVGWLTYREAADEGLYLLGPLIDRADRVLTTSAFTAELARLQRPDRAGDIVDVGFAYPEPEPSQTDGDVRWLATFGYQHEIKATDLIVEAFSLLAAQNPDLQLAIVGQVAVEFAPVIEGMIKDKGLTDRVVVTSRIDPDEYASWLRRTDVAVQLRRATNGEVSAAIGDCLRFGTPTIVTALGPAADLPDDVVHKVASDADAPAVAAAIQELTSDATSRSSLGANAYTYIEERGFDAAAVRLLEAVGLGTG
ncbi:MAG: hypothetical protein BMS9Abin20_1317 [Acidimicrobiia bacterium]|nr:MAG: hypothetical protein BMS9Abin20_1317 [Acidimicrobiia bacterium]